MTGLFTIGTPHDGSFFADLAVGVSILPCGDLICSALKTIVAAVMAKVGAAAVTDLTWAARKLDNLTLATPLGSTFVFAGTACRVNEYLSRSAGRYFFPNDGAVGLSSALGEGANLGRPTEYEHDLWHNEKGWLLGSPLLKTPFGTVGPEKPFGDDCAPPPVRGENDHEFTAPVVIGVVQGALRALTPPATAARAAPRARIAVATKRPVVQARVRLLAAKGRRVTPGRRVGSGNIARVAAKTPFSLSCKGGTLPALRVFGADLYVVPVVPCGRPKLISKRALGLVVLKDGARARASVRMTGRKATIRLTARARVRGVSIRVGRRALRAKAHRKGRRGVTLTVRRPRRTTRVPQIVARIAGERYAGLLPIARGP